jgi:hypothetical protein
LVSFAIFFAALTRSKTRRRRSPENKTKNALFQTQVIADPVVNGFFANTDMNAQRRKQLSFMMYAFGGPEGYKGKDMFEAHKTMNLKEE